MGDELVIDAAFPAGNILIGEIQRDSVRLRPDLRDTEGHWFYWCFRVRNAQGRALSFQFSSPNCLAARGPAVSLDHGVTWSWLNGHGAPGDSFAYRFPPDARCVLFSMGMPYTQAHWEVFRRRLGNAPHLRHEVLCTSGQGRAVESLLLGLPQHQPRYRILLTARHHACEMMANYELEGILEAALADDELGRWYRQNAEILAIPFVDKDGVENGDQGKNRRPHDHNRDYDATSIYPETAAIRQRVPEWSGGTPTLFLDLHCPWIHSGLNEKAYQPGGKDPQGWREQQRFGQCLQQAATGPIPYFAKDDLPYGQDWNTDRNFTGGLSSSRWARTLPDMRLATTIELPYASASGQEVNPTTARQFGQDVAKALQMYCLQLHQ